MNDMHDLPKVILCDALLRDYFGAAIDGYAPPPFWEAADPLARLREVGAEARVLVAYGGLPSLPALVEALPNLGCLLVAAAGYEGVDFEMLARRGIVSANSGAANSDDVADLALGLAIAARRKILEGDGFVRSGAWLDEQPAFTRSFSAMRAGIVGYGHIGKAIGRRLDGFGVASAWWSPRPQPGESRPRADSLIALAEASDLLIVACPGGPATLKMVDRAIIEAVGPGGLIVSIARGSVIDESALIEALKDGRLGGAALDVFEAEPTPAGCWADVPNILLSPHAAGQTHESRDATRAATLDNIRRFLAGEPLLNPIGASPAR